VFYRYRVHDTDGYDVGMAHYAVLIRPGEEIIIGKGVGVPPPRSVLSRALAANRREY
jgi:hypothetical protein